MLFDFNSGTHIQCSDGQIGSLEGLVVNPDTLQVTNLLVKKGFLLSKQTRVLPLALVKSASIEGVQMVINSDKFDHYPLYRLVEYDEPVTDLNQTNGAFGDTFFAQGGLYGTGEGAVPLVKKTIHEGIAADEKVIGPKTPLKNIEGTIGTIALVMVDRDQKTITHLTVDQGFFSTDQVVIPISMVESINNDELFTSYTSEELKEFLH